MGEMVWLCFSTQNMLYIKSLPAFKPQWVVHIEWEVRGHMCLLVNPLGPNTSVGKCSTLIPQPAIDVSTVASDQELLANCADQGVTSPALPQCTSASWWLSQYQSCQRTFLQALIRPKSLDLFRWLIKLGNFMAVMK